MIGYLYQKILKPILFSFPADNIHHLFLKTGKLFGESKIARMITSKIFLYENRILTQNVLGYEFKNPIGLAAGYDYEAELIEILPSVSFGYQTIGTITNEAYEGNPKPMLGRLPKSKSLLVNKGFKNPGIDEILKRVKKKKKAIPLGISIGTTNKAYQERSEMVDDIISCFKKAIKSDYFDYFELNISCPNLINMQNIENKFDSKEGLDLILGRINNLGINKPLFIKMHVEKSEEETLELCNIASRHSIVTGLIFSNLVKDRNNPEFDKEEISKAGKGNFSGKPTEKLTNNLISVVYKNFSERFLIIGCGGVFTGQDAYEKIKRGATLIQLITGMIYMGPQQIREINKELVELLKKDGYKNINEAIGVYNKKAGM